MHAISSRDQAVSIAWARKFGIPKAYGAYEALLADPDIDAVYIPLPNELHKPWVLAAANAGKHVLCEKPLTLDSREALALRGTLPKTRRPLDGSLHVEAPGVHASHSTNGARWKHR